MSPKTSSPVSRAASDGKCLGPRDACQGEGLYSLRPQYVYMTGGNDSPEWPGDGAECAAESGQ